MPSVADEILQHFDNRDALVRLTYDAIVKAARRLGPVNEEARKTSIHLVRKTAFAGVATRKAALILTLKSATDIASERVCRRQQTSTNRWHLEVRLQSPDQVDGEIADWLKKAYELGG